MICHKRWFYLRNNYSYSVYECIKTSLYNQITHLLLKVSKRLQHFSWKWIWYELPLVPRKTWNCVIKIGMKKGKKYFVTDTTIFFTQKLHTSVYINDHALYSFTFYSFYIYSVVAFFIFWLKCNKQIIFVMKYGVILYQTDKHCLP